MSLYKTSTTVWCLHPLGGPRGLLQHYLFGQLCLKPLQGQSENKSYFRFGWMSALGLYIKCCGAGFGSTYTRIVQKML